ncbi:MAG: head-tail connector protein [Aeromonas sp.]
MTLLSLKEIKAHLRLDASDDLEDDLLQQIGAAAIDHLSSDICGQLIAPELSPDGTQQPLTPALRMAALLLVGHWYTHRDAVVSGTIITTTPLAYASLIHPYRSHAIG